MADKQWNFISHSHGSWKFERRVPAWWHLVRAVLQTAQRICSIVFSHAGERSEDAIPLVTQIRALIALVRAPGSWPHLVHITSQGRHLLIPSYGGVGFSMGIWGEHKHSVQNILPRVPPNVCPFHVQNKFIQTTPKVFAHSSTGSEVQSLI